MAIQTLEGALPPEVTGQPVDQVAEPGDIAAFSVVATDARGLTFQWNFNGAPIVGAVGDSLVLTNVSAADEGQYTVVLTNVAGSVTSAPASLLLDTDGDGLPDSWEIAHFGTTASQRSEGDPDGDGVSTLDEFLDGTDPMSNTSLRPRLIVSSDAGGTVEVVPMKLTYDLGETVELKPAAFPPSAFAGWAGDLTGATFTPDLTMKLTMSGNRKVRVKFASAVPFPQGLVALWRGGTEASDAIGGHNGTFFKGTAIITPSVAPPGKVGEAFGFDGTVHVEVPDAPELRPAQITLEAWVFSTLFTDQSQAIIARGSSTSGADTWLLGVLSNFSIVNGGQPHFQTSPFDDLVAPTLIPLNQWTHLAASFDGTTKRLYVNGVLVASKKGLSDLVYEPAAAPVTIGARGASNTPFTGRVDEVAIYNRALTGNEIVDIFNADILGKQPI